MISVILGIIASFLPYLAFRFVFFKSDVTAPPSQMVKVFYLSAILKFISFIVVFSLILQWSKLHLTVFFLAFALAELSRLLYFWFNAPRIITK